MEVKDIGSEVQLRGKKWTLLMDSVVGNIFDTMYQVFILCASIGIMKDKRIIIELDDEDKDYVKTIARTVLIRNIKDLDFLFSTAIISTYTEDFSVDHRLKLAFGSNEDFKKMRFIEEFANAGMEDMLTVIDDNDLVMMQNIKDLFNNLAQHDYLEDIELDINIIL